MPEHAVTLSSPPDSLFARLKAHNRYFWFDQHVASRAGAAQFLLRPLHAFLHALVKQQVGLLLEPRIGQHGACVCCSDTCIIDYSSMLAFNHCEKDNTDELEVMITNRVAK